MRLWKMLVTVVGLLAPWTANAAGGVVAAVEYGVGTWSMDKPRLARQLPPPHQDPEGDLATLFADHIETAQALTLRLGYNILGHASVEGHVTATGWALTTTDRGGGGFAGGSASWHPLQIFLPERNYDAEVFAGFGYGLVGQRKGADGGAFLWGVRAQYQFPKLLFVGASVRVHHLMFSSLYRNYDQRELPGQTIALPEGSGGAFVTVSGMAGIQFDPFD